MPLSVIAEPPSIVIFPPVVAVDAVIDVAAVVVRLAIPERLVKLRSLP